MKPILCRNLSINQTSNSVEHQEEMTDNDYFDDYEKSYASNILTAINIYFSMILLERENLLKSEDLAFG